MSLSFVVVTWRSARDLRRLIASMAEHLDPAVELVVVDNASGDGVESELGAWPGERQFIAMGENAGYGAAANRGVEAASGDAIVLLNPDTELLDASLVDLAHLALDRQALVGPRIVGGDGLAQPSASGPPVGVVPWLGALVPGGVQPRRLRERTEPWRLDETVAVTWLSGACVAAPREVLRRLGPFDPVIHLYGEDMDLGLRASRACVPSCFCPDVARVVHYGRGSTSQVMPEGPWELMARNRRAVVRRTFGVRRERASHAAVLANLGLRVASKRLLGHDTTRDRAALQAAWSARDVPALSGSPEARSLGQRP